MSRGRCLLDNLRAARSPGTPAADLAEHSGPPLDQNLDSFFALQGELPKASAHAQEAAALLDVLPPVNVVIRGRQLTDLLRPGYRALASEIHPDEEREQPDE